MVLVAREDGERIGRLVTSGHPVWADLSIPNKIGGPIAASNVVAEIKGSERPGEFVVLGAHLDSWELARCADNGCNTALVVRCAEDHQGVGIEAGGRFASSCLQGRTGMMDHEPMRPPTAMNWTRRREVAIIDAGIGT